MEGYRDGERDAVHGGTGARAKITKSGGPGDFRRGFAAFGWCFSLQTCWRVGPGPQRRLQRKTRASGLKAASGWPKQPLNLFFQWRFRRRTDSRIALPDTCSVFRLAGQRCNMTGRNVRPTGMSGGSWRRRQPLSPVYEAWIYSVHSVGKQPSPALATVHSRSLHEVAAAAARRLLGAPRSPGTPQIARVPAQTDWIRAARRCGGQQARGTNNWKT